MFGLLPPSSSETWANRLPAVSADVHADAGDPVNETLSTSGMHAAAPRRSPSPCR